MKTLSFITTIYNIEIEFLDNLFESFGDLINSNDLEFIIIDDFSDKYNSYENLKKRFEGHKNFSFYKMNKNTKRTKAFKKGIEMASGKYLHSLDADDQINSNSLSIAIEILKYIESDFILNSFFFKDYSTDFLKEDGMYRGESKSNIIINNNFTKWPTFAAYNSFVKTNIAKTANYDDIDIITAPHDDAYFAQKWISNSNTTFFLDEPFFIYNILHPWTTFSGADSISDKQKNLKHWILVKSILKEYDKNNELTIINIISILTSHYESIRSRNSFYKLYWAIKVSILLDGSIKRAKIFKKSLFNRKYFRGFWFWR